MRQITFNLLVLLQRADAALSLELHRRSPDRYAITLLRRRKRLLAARLRRSSAPALLAGA